MLEKVWYGLASVHQNFFQLPQATHVVTKAFASSSLGNRDMA